MQFYRTKTPSKNDFNTEIRYYTIRRIELMLEFGRVFIPDVPEFRDNGLPYGPYDMGHTIWYFGEFYN